MSLQAGKLNKRVSIERKSEARTAANQRVDAYEIVDRTWASAKGATGMAVIRQSTPQQGIPAAANSVSYRMRYREDIAPGMFVTLNDGDDQPIESTRAIVRHIRPDHERGEYIDVVCESGTAT